MYDLNLIKSRISCVAYAQRIGLPITKSGDRCISPLRTGAKNPSSFVVYDDFYYDFASGNGGDVIELCAATHHNGDRGSAIRELATLTGVPSDNHESTQAWLDYTNQLNAQTAYYHTQLTDDDRRYLYSRGLSDGDISRLRIGRVTDGALRGRLFLPYFSGADGYVCYYATRALPGGAFPDSKYMKQKRDEHSQHLPWGLQTLNRDSDTLVIAEGYFDAVSFEIRGYPVLSAITGRFSRDQIPVVLSVARKFKRIFIVYDNDATSHAGESFTHSMSELLTKHRLPFVVGSVPPPYHDISEYFAAGGDLSAIISNAEDGRTYITSRFTDFSKLESYIYTLARYTKRFDLETIFATIRRTSTFDPKRLDALFKSATTAPPETIIVDEILRNYQLVYLPNIGFYEYFGGVWNKQPEEVIASYVHRAYGEFATYNRVRATTGLLKTCALRTDIQFDKQPVWNFVNGTLELETNIFRDHNPNDYCSVQVDYPYNPDATYTAWSQFIDDVTAGDPRMAEILQFIPGYALMHDNRYEKIFVLTGEGGNGKSRYLEIIELLFGKTNISHLSPRDLLKDFKLIHLKDAILNIAREIRSDVSESQEIMKSIATGEAQMACYKHQQYVTFEPRVKQIVALNGQLASTDTSDALTRRLIILDFKVSFVDDPDPNNQYERQKNINILDDLTTEINSGGIFNWAYEGYKLLNAVGYFTETDDQSKLLQEFRRASNPVLVFWEESDHRPSEYDYQQAYEDYTVWCGNNGYKPTTSQKFHSEYRRVSAKHYEPTTKSIRVDGKPRKRRFYRLRDYK